MALPIIGSIYNSIRMTELNIKWNQRKANPNMPKADQEDLERARYRADFERIAKSNVISSLDTKLKAGGELTDKELQYLREHAPQLYQEAIEIKKERQAYKKQLQSCKTKEDVQKLHTRKMEEFLAETRVIRSNPNIPEGKKQELMDKILRRFMGIENEHIKFVQSEEFQRLPSEEEVEEEEKKKKKQAPPPEDAPDNSEAALEAQRDELMAMLGGAGTGQTEDASENITIYSPHAGKTASREARPEDPKPEPKTTA